MTDARTFRYKTNLARKMSAPGGRPIADAIARADAGLQQHRAAAMAALVDCLAALEASCAAQNPGSERGVYDRAAALLDLAGFFDTGPLCRAAFSLCELADRLIETGAWNWPSIDVHVRALRLILADDCRETEQADLLLEGLSTILSRFSHSRGN